MVLYKSFDGKDTAVISSKCIACVHWIDLDMVTVGVSFRTSYFCFRDHLIDDNNHCTHHKFKGRAFLIFARIPPPCVE